MNKTVIKAEIVADSLSPKGDRLTSLRITFPRIILAEINTHRMLSSNTSSSRAIPFKKMVEAVKNDPFIPIAWQKNHSGMQGTEYFTSDVDIKACRKQWLDARDGAVLHSSFMYHDGTTKQLCNRLLEPFMWTTMLITGSKEGWDNFFRLRCPAYDLTEDNSHSYRSKKDYEKDYGNAGLSYSEWLLYNKGQSEIHMMDLAEKIYDAVNESTPKQLKAGEWHVPLIRVLEN